MEPKIHPDRYDAVFNQLEQLIRARVATLALFVGRPRKSTVTATDEVMRKLTYGQSHERAAVSAQIVELAYPQRPTPHPGFWRTPLGRIVAETWDTNGADVSFGVAGEILDLPKSTVSTWVTRGQMERGSSGMGPSLSAVLVKLLSGDPKSLGRVIGTD